MLVLPEPEPLGGEHGGGLEDPGGGGETPGLLESTGHGVKAHRLYIHRAAGNITHR